MALSHAGFAIPGIHSALPFGDIERHESVLSQFGNPGAAVLSGGFILRPFEVPIWIFNGYTAAQLSAFLNDLEDQFGTIGTLTETDGLEREVTHVILDNFARAGDYIPPNTDKGYSIEGVLKFRQLKP